MAKTDVYSWRLATELKDSLQEAARSSERSVAELLETITREWLADSSERRRALESEQARLRQEASSFVGSIGGGDPDRSRRVRGRVRARLESRAG